MNPGRGVALALCALVCWSIAPFFLSAVGRRLGPLATNMLRLAMATAALLAFILIRRLGGAAIPLPQPGPAAWMMASGVIGLTIGDAFLYRAFVSVGPERTSQIQVIAPAATAFLAWLALDEILSGRQLAGMALILGGVLAATTYAAAAARRRTTRPPEAAGFLPRGLGSGVWAALWSALFQGLGTALARKAFLSQPDLDPIFATSIRIGSGTLALWAYAAARGPLRRGLGAWKEPRTFRILCVGSALGPILGMICYVAALKSAPAGIVTTITFMAPLLIIPIGAHFHGTRVGKAALAGTVLSLAGVVLLGLG